MKLLIISILILLARGAFAEEQPVEENISAASADLPSHVSSRSGFLLGLRYLQWNEKLKLEQGANSAYDKANFAGIELSAEKDTYYLHWGWRIGFDVSTGTASGGGTSSQLIYETGNRSWTGMAIHGKIYRRLSNRVNFGLELPVAYRSISWPEQNSVQPTTSGKNFNIGLLAELIFKISQSFELSQSVGPYGNIESTFWGLGLGYRF